MNTISTINVPFHGDNLYVVNYNGEPHVPMKPIVEGMGLDWKSQFSKIKSRFSKGMVEITIPTKGGEQSMICLALRKLTGWLHTISPNKVKAEIRDKVIQYQEECDDVLYEYWTTGEVKAKPRKQVKQIAGRITSEQQEAIKQLVLNRGKALPKEKQAKAMITMWSSLKSHFGCTYKEIDSDKFTEALSLAARVPLEGEYLPKQAELPMAVTNTLTDDELLNLCYVWSDSLEMIRLMLDVSPLLQVAEHRLAPNFYEMPREAMRKANLLRRTIEKATEHIQIKRNEFSEWRILHRIRIPDMPW
ncbi:MULTISPECIES: phage antirepressor N-terminal domain-containing protein [unclassified Providencia]|uniref:phage antirepressor N-terminal domain-containing protein n=1 Tax=unclassified Providencia TaxID=2633465 RepID=UPI00298FFB09|nr:MULTISPECIES: phage antirepressor N-terminal domain-containing protein [unclassified Providencia]